jgi:hypothetical protein
MFLFAFCMLAGSTTRARAGTCSTGTLQSLRLLDCLNPGCMQLGVGNQCRWPYLPCNKQTMNLSFSYCETSEAAQPGEGIGGVFAIVIILYVCTASIDSLSTCAVTVVYVQGPWPGAVPVHDQWRQRHHSLLQVQLRPSTCCQCRTHHAAAHASV